MTFCSLISFSDSPDTARRLRGLILPQGPLRWVAFERGSTRAVVAMEDDYVSSAMAVIERMAILQQSVTVADAVEMVEHKVRVHFRSFPFEIERRPGGSRDVTGLFFVHCPPESRDGLEREFGSASVSFDLSESTDLAMIQLFELDEAAILADLESCSVVDGIVVDEVFWGDSNRKRGWRRPRDREQFNWEFRLGQDRPYLSPASPTSITNVSEPGTSEELRPTQETEEDIGGLG